MSENDIFESWKRERTRGDVPSGFAARVMTRIAAPEPRESWFAWCRPRLAPAGWMLLAVVVCVVRLRVLFSVFLTP